MKRITEPLAEYAKQSKQDHISQVSSFLLILMKHCQTYEGSIGQQADECAKRDRHADGRDNERFDGGGSQINENSTLEYSPI